MKSISHLIEEVILGSMTLLSLDFLFLYWGFWSYCWWLDALGLLLVLLILHLIIDNLTYAGVLGYNVLYYLLHSILLEYTLLPFPCSFGSFYTHSSLTKFINLKTCILDLKFEVLSTTLEIETLIS